MRSSHKPLSSIFPLLILFAAFIPPDLAYTQEINPDERAAAEADYRQGLRNARDALMVSEDFEAALDPAQLIIRELEAVNEDASPDRVILAIILAELGSFDEAEIELLNVLDSVEDTDGQFSEALVTPLRFLGRTYMHARRFPEAITALTQARDVSRRTAGLFNVEHQIAVIDDLTTAYLGLRDTVAAHELQQERLTTAQRQFGEDNPEVIPYHNEYAGYLERSRLRQSAREQYETVFEIAEATSDTRQMLAALSNIVRQDLQAGDTRAARKQLAELADTEDAQIHSQELGVAHAVLGDAALVDEEESEADSHYARAWNLLAAAEETDPAEYFADPVAIQLIPPLTIVDVTQRERPYEFGSIEIVFDVADNGRVEQITQIGSQPPELMDEAYVERLLAAWFRPPLVDGERTAATNVMFTHYFRFYIETDD